VIYRRSRLPPEEVQI
jgi:hypothetical protein